jgi:hypothetical protein
MSLMPGDGFCDAGRHTPSKQGMVHNVVARYAVFDPIFAGCEV